MKIGNCDIQIKLGDITDLDVDVIVNPANKRLHLGSGVAGAIRQKGGSSIQAECYRHKPISVGKAVMTTGGSLKAKYVIHAVGPRGGSLFGRWKLRQALHNSLKLMIENNLDSIGIPAISTGFHIFNVKKCARILIREAIRFAEKHQKPKKIIFCLLGKYKHKIFEEQLSRISHKLN